MEFPVEESFGTYDNAMVFNGTNTIIQNDHKAINGNHGVQELSIVLLTVHTTIIVLCTM